MESHYKIKFKKKKKKHNTCLYISKSGKDHAFSIEKKKEKKANEQVIVSLLFSPHVRRFEKLILMLEINQ